MRDRLIELLNEIQNEGRVYDEENEIACIVKNSKIADYLISKGVVAPPCKIGDDLWWIADWGEPIRCSKNDIRGICYFGGDVFKIIEFQYEDKEGTTIGCYIEKCFIMKRAKEADARFDEYERVEGELDGEATDSPFIIY